MPRRVVLSSRLVARVCAGACAAAAGLCLARSAAAQAAGERPVSVTISEQRDPPARARGVTRVQTEQLREVAPGSLADAMRWQLGTSVQQTTPGQGTVYVRGLSGRAVLHEVDGLRLNAAFFRAGNNPYLGLVDPYALEQVDVERGAASVEHGSDALAGAIRMRTRLPGYSLSGVRYRASVRQSVTSNPVGGATRVAAERAGRAWSAHVGASWYGAGPIEAGGNARAPDPDSYVGLVRASGEPYRPRTGAHQEGTEYSVLAADAVLRHKLGAGSELRWRLQGTRRPELERVDRITPGYGETAPRRADFRLAPMTRSAASVEWVRRSRDPALSQLSVLAGWQRLREHRVERDMDELCVEGGVIVPGASDCTGVFRLEPADVVAEEDNRSDAVTLAARASSRAGSLAVRWGADLHHDVVHSEASSRELSTGLRRAEPERYPDGSSLTQLGAFGAGELELSRAWAVLAGARAALFLLDVAARSVDPDDSSPASRRTLPDAAAHAGVRWTPARSVALMLRGARGVRSPNVQDVASLGTRAAGRFQVPNDDLGAEHSLSVDVTGEVRHERVRVETALFYLRHDGAIVLAPTTVAGSSTSPAGDTYVTSVNAARVTVYGIEGALEAPVAAGFVTFARWLAMLGEQRNPAAADLPERTPADRVPPAQGELGLRWSHGEVDLTGFIAGRAKQDRLNDPTNVNDNRIPADGTPGYLTLHARGSVRPDDALRVWLMLDNITDARVREHGSGFDRPGFAITAAAELIAR